MVLSRFIPLRAAAARRSFSLALPPPVARHPVAWSLAALLAGSGPLALAQPANGQLPPSVALPTDAAEAARLWRQANDQVAEFPRGHMDVLRWEARQSAAGQTVAAEPSGPTLTMGEALRLSLKHRPDLFVHANMNAVERGEVTRAYLDHARQVQQAWINAVAAGHSLRLLTEVLESARTGAELGRRMVASGNWSEAKGLRETLTEAQAWQAWTQSQRTAAAAREQLAALLGVGTDNGEPGADQVRRMAAQLPRQLDTVPATLAPGVGVPPSDVEAAVLRSHPTLAWQQGLAQRRVAALASGRMAAWDAQWATAVADLEASPMRAPTLTDLSLLRDHALESAVDAQANVVRLVAERRAMARQAWGDLQAQHARAQHTQNTLGTLGTRLEQETVQRYNGMLQSTWDLLASSRERMRAQEAAVQAQRDFWLAHTAWQTLLAGGDYRPAAGADVATGTSESPAKGH